MNEIDRRRGWVKRANWPLIVASVGAAAISVLPRVMTIGDVDIDVRGPLITVPFVIGNTYTLRVGEFTAASFTGVFASQWGAATGTSDAARLDGTRFSGKTGSSGLVNIDVVTASSKGFDSEWITTNAFRVQAAHAAQGFVYTTKGAYWDTPAVGEDVYFRWYMRVTLPGGTGTDQLLHPICASNNESLNAGTYDVWCLELQLSGTTEWRPGVRVEGSNVKFFVDSGDYLDRNETYRFEVHAHRDATDTWNLHIRIYDVDDNLILDDDDFRNQAGSVELNTTPSIAINSGVDGLSQIVFGTEGFADGLGSDPPYDYVYYGGVCVRTDDWCGAYDSSEDSWGS